MGRPPRACLVCGEPFHGGGSRCPRHRRYPPKPATTNQLGLGWDHRRQRAALLLREDRCWICGGGAELIPVKGPWEADHVLPRSMGGTNEPSNYRLAHRLCNIGRGGKNRRRNRRGS
jgi:hypothetical protein